MVNPSEVTRLLIDSREGDGAALDELLPLVHDELHAMAQARLRGERVDHTLAATALVNEAYLRLVEQRNQSWENRSHFFCIAATVMRRILVNHALAKRAAKRGGDWEKVTLDEAVSVLQGKADDMLALNDSLEKLADSAPDKARIVEMSFFAGLTHPEIAEALDVSLSTVERSWRFAKAWLRKDMGVATAEG